MLFLSAWSLTNEKYFCEAHFSEVYTNCNGREALVSEKCVGSRGQPLSSTVPGIWYITRRVSLRLPFFTARFDRR